MRREPLGPSILGLLWVTWKRWHSHAKETVDWKDDMISQAMPFML